MYFHVAGFSSLSEKNCQNPQNDPNKYNENSEIHEDLAQAEWNPVSDTGNIFRKVSVYMNRIGVAKTRDQGQKIKDQSHRSKY